MAAKCVLFLALLKYICDRTSDYSLPNLRPLRNGTLFLARSTVRCPDFRKYSTFSTIYAQSNFLRCECMQKAPNTHVVGCLPSDIKPVTNHSLLPSDIKPASNQGLPADSEMVEESKNETEIGRAVNKDYTYLAWLIPLISGTVVIVVIVIVMIKERISHRLPSKVVPLDDNQAPSAPPLSAQNSVSELDDAIQLPSVPASEIGSKGSTVPCQPIAMSELEIPDRSLEAVDDTFEYEGDYSSMPELSDVIPIPTSETEYRDASTSPEAIDDTDLSLNSFEYDGDYP